jgi:drug/metabolite transporter (DMT)-like permease
MKARQDAATYIAAGLVSALLFGAATPASKILLHDLAPQTLAGLLYLGAALGVLPAVIKPNAFKWPRQAGRRTVMLLTGAIALGGILGPLLLLVALRFANAGSVSLWLNLEFVATVMLGHFIFKESLTLRGWIAATGIFAAAMLLAEGSGGGLVPVALVALGCICWGLDNHFTALIDGISPAQTTFCKGAVAGIFNLIAGSVLSGGITLSTAFYAALLVGAFSYGVSITLYVTAAQRLGAVRSQMLFSTAPFFGLLLSWTVLGEAFTWIQAVSAGLMAVSLTILFTERHAHLHRHDFLLHRHIHRHDGLHHNHDHAEAGKARPHSDWHQHPPAEHSHKHWPDLHHRHDHKKKPD